MLQRAPGSAASITASIISCRSAAPSGRRRDPPQVQLVRLAGVQPVDVVAAVHQAGADEQQVGGRIGRDLA